MAKLLSEQVFPYLALGLAKYTENEPKYPYPPELLYAQHHLSLAMLTSYPATITGFFELCKNPLEEWWPSNTLPTDIDKRFELLTPDGDLDERVIDYLIASKLPDGVTLQDIQVILESQLMGNIRNIAWQAALYDPVVAQRDYVAVRSYVLTHPWTTREKLHRELRGLRYIKINEVGDLYQDSHSVSSALLYHRPDLPEPCYWNCSVCGPLYQRHKRLGSIKPGACEKRCPGMQGWQPLDILDNTLVLKGGVHLSTHIPGTAEMRLYRWLMDEVQPGQPDLQQVVLWPGVDSYDLHLVIRDRVWAVDVKDFKDPFTLGKKIKQESRPFNQSDLAWHEWFYVYPMYRELQRPDYRECVQRAAEGLPSNIFILSEKQFKAQVLRVLTQ